VRIRIGSTLAYNLPQPTPMIALLNVHYSRFGDLEQPDHLITTPQVPVTSYRDNFGNWCNRLTAPAGSFKVSTSGIIRDNGERQGIELDAAQHAVEDLPSETITYLLGSRYCETDRLTEEAWRLFGSTRPGAYRVQAICDFVHGHISFGYAFANASRSAVEVYHEKRGVCRDYAHLAITLCRCMNIPARYCTGYLSDIGEQPPFGPGDHAAWMEVFLDGRWHTFDPRNNAPRIGRILIAQGRDAADVPLMHTFGPNELTEFEIVTAEA
jgi:transglutaminase-like putative cysteine protease